MKYLPRKIKVFLLGSGADFKKVTSFPCTIYFFSFRNNNCNHCPLHLSSFLKPTMDNGIGSKNNVVSVRKTDFEVFDALDIDSTTVSGTLGTGIVLKISPKFS